MKITKIMTQAFALTLMLAGVAHADEWDKKTIFTVSQSFVVPGAQYAHHMTAIPAGTYAIRLLRNQGVPSVALITDEYEQHVYASVLPIPADNTCDRYKPGFVHTKHNLVEFAYGASLEDSLRLKHWNYPGDSIGYDFAD